MKCICVLVFASALAVCHGSALDASMNPVSRLVELLQGIATKTELDGKAEEKLFEKYVCWAKSVISSKTASNAAADSRIQNLQTYIADIEAGRIEFTSERTDLEKELEELNSGIEAATEMRKKEHEEFLDAEDEMAKTIAALDKAITVLREATAGHEEGALLVQGAQLSSEGEGFAKRVEEAGTIDRAVQLGEKFLTKGDALFLRRLLAGDVPNVDWKKLNRKATFKLGYKARSFKIQEVLANLQTTFTKSLADAKDKEGQALALFDKLMESKNTEKSMAEDALLKLEGENGARSMSKEEAQGEVDALTTQVANDKKFIEQTQGSLAEKTGEWKERMALRANEISAMSKAISILHNDDARDLFKRSHASQGYTLLQKVSATSHGTTKFTTAAAAIRAAATSSRSTGRLSTLALLVASGKNSHFAEVMEAIDKMIVTLKEEEKTDLTNKEQCETDRDANTRTAAVTSRSMDELTDAMTKLKSEIEEINAEITEKQDTIKTIQEQLAEATENRAAENKEWTASDADDDEASKTVGRAKEVLKEFYASNNLMLAQQPAAGEAPEPPPATWDAPYGGKTAESTSVIAVLEMIAADIDRDRAGAKDAEDKSQVAYDSFKTESEEQIVALQGDITTLTGTKSDKEESISTKTEERTTAGGELAAVMKMIADMKPGCDFIAVNFPLRLKNRQIEIDGLTKAKAILEGAEFNAGPDANREIKPGDAFLQRRHQ